MEGRNKVGIQRPIGTNHRSRFLCPSSTSKLEVGNHHCNPCRMNCNNQPDFQHLKGASVSLWKQCKCDRTWIPQLQKPDKIWIEVAKKSLRFHANYMMWYKNIKTLLTIRKLCFTSSQVPYNNVRNLNSKFLYINTEMIVCLGVAYLLYNFYSSLTVPTPKSAK